MTIEQRVEKLERQNRWMRRIAVLVVVVAGAVLYVKGKMLPPLLEVGAVQVKTRVDGKTRVLPQGILLFDRDGKTRAVYRRLDFSNAKGDVIWQTPR